jgi:hypothetical protein
MCSAGQRFYDCGRVRHNAIIARSTCDRLSFGTQ